MLEISNSQFTADLIEMFNLLARRRHYCISRYILNMKYYQVIYV